MLRQKITKRATEQNALLRRALIGLTQRCPRLAAQFYWAGTSAIALEELCHRQSFDLDLHTRKALLDVRPLLAEITRAFPGQFTLLQAPDEFGSGFRGVLKLPGGKRLTLEVLSNFEDVPDRDLTPSRTAPPLKRVSLARYLADKVQCLAERSEARDLVDIMAVIQAHPEMESRARAAVKQQDPLLLAERLLAWTDSDIRNDLASYPEVDPSLATAGRDLILGWLKRKTTRKAGRP
jgi:hypothetical protein